MRHKTETGRATSPFIRVSYYDECDGTGAFFFFKLNTFIILITFFYSLTVQNSEHCTKHRLI